MFELDPHVKRECIWHGRSIRKLRASRPPKQLRRLATTRDEEPVMLTRHLADTDRCLPASLIRSGLRKCSRFVKLFAAGASTTISAPMPTLPRGLRRLAPSRLYFSMTAATCRCPQTILEIRSDEALHTTLRRRFSRQHAFCGSAEGRFELHLRQHGLLRFFPQPSCRKERCAISYGLLLCSRLDRRNLW